MLGRWLRHPEKRRGAKQQGDPRGGLQSEEYRHSDPRELVKDEGVVMSGPAGAPQEGESVEERRARDGSDRS